MSLNLLLSNKINRTYIDNSLSKTVLFVSIQKHLVSKWTYNVRLIVIEKIHSPSDTLYYNTYVPIVDLIYLNV